MQLSVHEAFDQLVYRKLHCERTQKMLLRVQDFIQQVEGKPYSLSFSKLFGTYKPLNDQGYFCSEIVAAAFQSAGVLLPKKQPHKYWPGNFQFFKPLGEFAKSDLSMLPGAFLGDPLVLDFTL